MEIKDVNGRRNEWEIVKEREFVSHKISGMSERNSKICIDVLKDL